MTDTNENMIKGDLRVLIVDDDLVFLDLIEGLLKSIGIKKVVRALLPIQQITTIGGHPHTAADPLTDAAQDILTATSHDSATH